MVKKRTAVKNGEERLVKLPYLLSSLCFNWEHLLGQDSNSPVLLLALSGRDEWIDCRKL